MPNNKSLLIIMFVFGCMTVQAQASGGIDVVFVIDQSGSMSGYTDKQTHRRIENDPNGLRIKLVHGIIRKLADDVTNTPWEHSVTIVEFGGDAHLKDFDSDVKVLLSDCRLSYDPKDPNKAKNDAIACRAKATNAGFIAKNMNDTNTPSALGAGKLYFDGLISKANSSGRQLKILLVTDGRPEVRGKTPSELRNLITSNDTDLDNMNVDFWVVGLNDSTNYWNTGAFEGKTDGAFWRSIAGDKKALLADSAEDMKFKTEAIVKEWLGEVETKLDCSTPLDKVSIRPYLSKVSWEVDFSQPRGKIQVTTPSGNQFILTPADMQELRVDWNPSNPPEAGNYQITNLSPDIHYCIRPTEVLGTVKMLSVEGNTHLKEAVDLSFQVYLSGRPLKNQSAWPVKDYIKPKVVVTKPSGAQQKEMLTYDSNGVFKISWTPKEKGKHQFSFSTNLVGVLLVDGSTKDYPLVENDQVIIGEVNVGEERSHAWLQMEQPDFVDSSEISFIPFVNDALPLRLSFMVDEKPETVTQYLQTKPNSWLSIDLVDDQAGLSLTDNQASPLQFNEDGEILVDIPISHIFTNLWKIDEWFRPHLFHIKLIQSSDAKLKDGTVFHGISLPDAHLGRRVSGDTMTVTGLTVVVQTWIPIAILLVLVGLLLILVLLALFVWWPSRELKKKDAGKDIRLLFCECEDINCDSPSHDLPLTGKVKVVRKKWQTIDDGGERKILTKLVVKRASSIDNSIRIYVKYRWSGEKQDHQISLEDGEQLHMEGLTVASRCMKLSTN